MLHLILPLLILAAGVSLAYWIGYPWPWSEALANPTFLDAASKTLPEPSPHRWKITPRAEDEDEPRYWFLRFSVFPNTKIYEQWAYGNTAVAAMNALSTATGGEFIVLDGDPINRLTPPRLDVKVFGEPPSAAAARLDHQRRFPAVNSRLALSEIQRASLPPCRNTPLPDTPQELQRVQYIVPQAWLAKPEVVEQLRNMQARQIADVLVMRHVGGTARPLSDFL